MHVPSRESFVQQDPEDKCYFVICIGKFPRTSRLTQDPQEIRGSVVREDKYMEMIGEEPLLLRAVNLAFSVPPNKLPIWSLSDYVKSASGPKPQSFSFKLVM